MQRSTKIPPLYQATKCAFAHPQHRTSARGSEAHRPGEVSACCAGIKFEVDVRSSSYQVPAGLLRMSAMYYIIHRESRGGRSYHPSGKGNSLLLRILPIILACTISKSPLTKARIAMSNSTAFLFPNHNQHGQNATRLLDGGRGVGEKGRGGGVRRGSERGHTRM